MCFFLRYFHEIWYIDVSYKDTIEENINVCSLHFLNGASLHFLNGAISIFYCEITPK